MNEDCKVLWDFIIQTYHLIEGWRSNLVVVDKDNRIWKIIDYLVPEDSRFEDKEKESIGKYKDLARELPKIIIWNVRGQLTPWRITTFRALPKRFGKTLKDIGTTAELGQFEKTVMLVMAKILKFLEMSGY